MKKQDESFDSELISRLRNYSEEPRSQLWQNIIANKEPRRRPLGWRKWMGTGWVVVLGVITIGGLYYFGKTDLKMTSSLTKTEIATTQSSKADGTVDDNSKSITSPAQEESSGRKVLGDDITTIASDIAKVPVHKHVTVSRGGTASIEGDNPSHSIVDNNLSSLDTEAFDIAVDSESNDFFDSSTEPEATKIDDVPEKEPVTKLVKKDPDKEVKTVIKEDKGKSNKFGIYFTVMPTFGYQRIKSNSTDDILLKGVHKVSAFSTKRLGVRAELGVEDPIAKRIKVFGGLVYFQRKQTIDYTEIQVDSTEVSIGPDGKINFEPVSKDVDKSFEYELKNLGVQIGVSYELSRKKFLQTIGTGFEFHIALNKLEDQYKSEFTNNPSAYVFYNFYYRLQYPAESKLKAVFQPTLNYSFYINQNLNAPFYVKPYGLGLNLGFTYNF